MSDLLGLIEEFHRDKLSALLGHIAAARAMTQYDVNNTYQYIINREETQLSWVGQAIADLGGRAPGAGVEPDRPVSRRGPQGERRLLEEDAHDAQAFVDRWRPRVDAMTHARHRGMLRVVLGETLEQKRFFDQALSGDTNLLGVRSDAVGARVGAVMATRWIE